MSEILRQLVSQHEETPERPYDPFCLATQTGKVVLDELIIRPLNTPLGVVLRSGYIPQQNDAGVIELGQGEIVAVDHGRLLEVGPSDTIFGPSCKDSVDKNSGKLKREGVVAITFPDGRLRYAAGAIDTDKNPWLAKRLGTTWKDMGGLTVVSFGLDAVDHEISDIDLKEGYVKTKPRRKYW